MKINLPSSLRLQIAIIAGLLTNQCLADTVWLSNGDRISGTVVEISASTLTIKTTYADTLSLDINAIQSFATDTAHSLQINLEERTAQVQKNDRPGRVTIEGETIALNELRFSPQKKHWKTGALLETSLDVDNDQKRKEHLHFNSELRLESKNWRHELKGEVKRDKEQHHLTENTQEYEYILDYLYNPHWLLRSDTIYHEEGTEVIGRYIGAGVGPGYRLWGERENKLDVIVSYDRFWFELGPIDLTLDALSTKLDYDQYWFDHKLQLFADIQLSHIFHVNIDYIANTSSGLRYYLTDHVHLSFKYEYNKTKYSVGKIKDSSYVLGAGMSL